MALLRVQAGRWVVCSQCHYLVWPFYDDEEPAVLDDRTLDVLTNHMTKEHKLDIARSVDYWDFISDLYCWLL